MRLSPLSVRYFSVVLIGVLLQAISLTDASASDTNVFRISDRLSGAGFTARGVRVLRFRGNSQSLLGTNHTATLGIAVMDSECTPTGVHPTIALVALDRATDKIVSTLLIFSEVTTLLSGDGRIIMNAHGVGGDGVAGANVDALIVYHHKPCSAAHPAATPVGITIRPLGTLKPTTQPAVPNPITPDNGTVVFTTDDPNLLTTEVSISGIATEPSLICKIDLNTTELSFGDVPVNTTATRALTIRNNGAAACSVNPISLNGSSAFSFSGASSFLIPPRTAVNRTVRFTPFTNGTDSAVLCVDSTDSDAPHQCVRLSGNGTAANPCNISADTTGLNFGAVEISTNRSLSVTLTNTGGTACLVDKITLVTQSSNFVVTPPSLPFNVGLNTSQVITVTYTPLTNSTDTGTLEIDTDDPDNRLILVSLNASGVAPACALQIGPTSLDFGAVVVGDSRDRTVSITNNSLAACTINTNTFSGSTDFFLNPPITTPFDLAPGQNTNFVFVFAPASNGTANASAVINATSGNTTISLTGLGAGASSDCVVRVSRTAIDFGNVAVGSTSVQKFEISSTGLTNCQVSALLVSNSDFSVIAPPLPIQLLGLTNVEIGVKYSPGTVGADAGTLQVISDDTNNPIAVIFLTGNALQPELTASTTNLYFGAIPVGTTTQLTAFVTNTGGVNATVHSITKSGSGRFELDPLARDLGQFILQPADSVAIPVLYRPGSAAADTGTISVDSDAINSPLTISLVGTGLQCNISIPTFPLAFGATELGQTNTMTVTVSNSGNTNCTVESVEFFGTSQYRVADPSVPFDVPGGQSVDVEIEYLPVNVQTIVILGGSLQTSGKPTIVTP